MGPIKPIIIVNGGQWGSEAKGLITHKLTVAKRVDWAVRTGTVNAGHTVYYKGQAYAMQQIPVSWVRQECNLVLGPGAYIHPDILMRELEWICNATGETLDMLLCRTFIDYRCGVHLPSHTQRSADSGRHHSIGTTGKGCSEAVMDKIQGRDRTPPPNFSNWLDDKPGFWQKINERMVDTTVLINDAYNSGHQVLVEGTQGTLLDLHLGDYPYTTHKQTQAANWLAEAGLSCTLETDLWLVMRTFPIKVAGNSGPMPGEISWAKIARQINELLGVDRVREETIRRWEGALNVVRTEWWPEVPSSEPAYWSQPDREDHREAASEMHKRAFDFLNADDQRELRMLFEFTTVTKKLRRIAEWTWPVADKSLMLNRPHHIALTFANYKWPELWGAEYHRAMGAKAQWGPWVDNLSQFSREKAASGGVDLISFGPQIQHTHLIGEAGPR